MLPPLWNHQTRTLTEIREAVKQGSRSICVVSPTGSGKSVMEAVCASNHINQGGRGVLVLAHRDELIKQLFETMSATDMPVSAIQANSSLPYNPFHKIQVASVQTLLARGKFPDASLVQFDECFPAGTIVDGRPIEDVVPGMLVSSFDPETGEKCMSVVARKFKRVPSSMVRVTFEDGWRLDCTPNHNLWTPFGWVAAGVSVGRGILCHDEEFRVVRRVEVMTIEETCRDGYVYNLEVEGTHTYFADGVAVSNCHHFASDEWGKLPAAYTASLVLGWTATPVRGDNRPLGDVFSHLIVGTTPKELTDLGVLVPLEIVAPSKPIKKGIAMDPVQAYMTYGPGRKCIVFGANLKACEEYKEGFAKHGIKAKIISYKSTNRHESLNQFKTGKINVLLSVSILTEGFDQKDTDMMINARTIGHVGLWLQCLGRILRASPATGKTSALLVDLTGTVHIHGDAVEEREYSLDGEGIRRKVDPSKHKFCASCGALVTGNVLICAECSTARPGQTIPEVTNDPMKKFGRVRKRNDEERKAHYFRMLDECAANGWKFGRAFYKYKTVYDANPERDWTNMWQAARIQ